MAVKCFSKEFMSALDSWLFKNEQKYADILSRATDVPPNFKTAITAYRGMVVDGEFLNSAKDGRIKFDRHTSWSMDKKTAIKFAKDPKMKVGNQKGIPILITKRLTTQQQILNIFNFVLFTGGMGIDETSEDSAMKEQEVLVKKGINISYKEIEVL